ncbi:MAG: DNA translocase FtsK 4TM domain-containing protein, partial [Pseudomonadota bacterium]|nr:DNA translocase FtsK 4TM domain-containing protein [Pseudomonadota bacterium]
MKNVTNELDKTTFLPDQLNVLIKKRLIEVFSVIIFFISTAFVTSILSYHPNDASLNTSSSEPIQNIMGSPGSIVSDLAIQNLGFAALLIFLTTACWGILLFRKIKIDLFWIRFVTLIFSILIAASALAGLGTMSFMDTVNGSGGIIGNILLNSLLEINNLIGLAAYEEKIYIALFALFFPIYLFSLGFSVEQ